MAQLTKIYLLREDREHIEAVQRAALETKDFGLWFSSRRRSG